MENVFLAQKNFNENEPNPFTVDGSYDRMWSIFIVDNTVQGMLFQRKSMFGCYIVAATTEYEFFSELMADFLQYETSHRRKVIFVSDGEAHKLIGNFQTHYKEALVRKSDPVFLVHSTTLPAYRQIVNEGLLKSPTRLKREGINVHAIGLTPLGEPDDYLDYVMFASGGLAPELVVNSRLCGGINCDPNIPYEPQARMYLDAHQMILDGLVVRDIGRKVFDNVPLDKYLLKTVFSTDLEIPNEQIYWTPSTFSAEADKYMNNTLK